MSGVTETEAKAYYKRFQHPGWMALNVERPHPDSEGAVRGRKVVNGMFLSKLHWDDKFQDYRRRREKHGVKKQRFLNTEKGEPNVFVRRAALPKPAKGKK